MSLTPSEEPNLSPASTAPETPTSLAALLMETLLLLGRYFIIVYPVFFYFILSSLIIPKTAPDYGHWAWWIIIFGLLAVFYIFKAGWSLMMYQAVQEWEGFRKKAVNQTLDPTEIRRIPFGLLKTFIPGVGEFGLSFLIGSILWFLLNALPVAALMAIGYFMVGVPAFAMKIVTQPNLTLSQLEQIALNLTPAEQAQVFQWDLLFLAGVILLIILNVLTLFWQPYVIIRKCSPFRAFFLSAKQVIKHPFRSVLILFFFMLMLFSFSMMASLSTFAAFFGNFLWILTMVYFGLFMFLYLSRTDVDPIA